MDLLKKMTECIGKYRYVVLIVIVGVLLMLLPASSDKDAKDTLVEQSEETDISEELEQILEQIQGVGKVQVMLTLEAGEMIHYQTDLNGDRTDTVIITDENRTEAGLIQYIQPAVYRGAIVVCQGADSAAVRFSVIEAVSKVTGLGTDRISVLKMK